MLNDPGFTGQTETQPPVLPSKASTADSARMGSAAAPTERRQGLTWLQELSLHSSSKHRGTSRLATRQTRPHRVIYPHIHTLSLPRLLPPPTGSSRSTISLCTLGKIYHCFIYHLQNLISHPRYTKTASSFSTCPLSWALHRGTIGTCVSRICELADTRGKLHGELLECAAGANAGSLQQQVSSPPSIKRLLIRFSSELILRTVRLIKPRSVPFSKPPYCMPRKCSSGTSSPELTRCFVQVPCPGCNGVRSFFHDLFSAPPSLPTNACQ